MTEIKLSVSVYEYDDFKSFLRAAYDDLSSRDKRVSYRWLQKRAGYSVSSNHFWQKMTGCSSLSENAALRYARVFGMNKCQTRYFVTLVHMNQATSDEARQMYLDQLRQFPQFQRHPTRNRVSYQLYEHWYLPALRSLVTLEDFREDPAWIAAALSPSITRSQARKGLKKLLDMGYLKRNPKGKLIQTEPMLGDYEDRDDSDDVARLAVRNFHRYMIDLGAQSIENQGQQQRYVVGNTMAISSNQMQQLRDEVRQFMQRVEFIVSQDEPIEVLYRLNVQLFSLLSEAQEKK